MTEPAPPSRPGWPPEAKLLAGLSLAIVIAWLVTSLLGGREATSVLTGTGSANGQALVLGAAHVATHLALVIVAPILALAAAIRAGLERRAPARP